MKKRLLSLILVFAMVFGMMPTMALAGDQMEDTVYISVSFDGQYVNDKTGEPMAYIPVSLSELQAIDLEKYGLTDYDYNSQLTALHLYIYTHETLMGEAWSDVDVQGGPGSIFFASGLFGFADCNLQYYCNGEYPANEEGWGITADQLVLNNGDFFDIAAYTSWSFYSDSAFGFHYFLDNEEIAHEYTATAGVPLTVTLGRGASSMTKVADYTVSYGTAFGTDTGTVTTNTDGQAEITFAEAGTYYLWVDGGYGAENPLDIVSAPGYAKVTVTAPACTHETWNPATCTTPKTCANCGETDGEADPEAHNYVGGTCEHCGKAEPGEPAFSGVTVNVSDMTKIAEQMYYFSLPNGTDLKVILSDTSSVTSVKNVETEADIAFNAPEAGQFVVTAEEMQNHYLSDAMIADLIPQLEAAISISIGADSEVLCLVASQGNNPSMFVIEIVPESSCAHSWSAATCTTPKTCSVCGATEGEVDPEAHSYVDGTCEHCGAAEPVATPSYTIKLSEAEELTAGLNYFISVPAEVLGKDIIFDFGSGTIKGAMCQRHCSKSDIWTAGEGSTMLIAADKVAAHLCNETRRAEVAEDFDLYLTEGSQMFAFYWWTTANMNGSYIYIEILPAEDVGGGDEEATYTVTLPTNNVGFSVRATSSPTVTSGGEFSFNLNIYDDYKKGENFKVLANGVELTSSGDTYTITNITANQTVTVEGVVEKTLAEKNVTVNAPAGSVVSSGAFHSYFKYDFVEPLQSSTLEDGRVQYIVPVTSGVGGFIRVQNPDGVTYWDFGDLTIGKVFDITDEMLFIGNTEYTKDTVYANYEKNGHDTASLYLTANAQGWLDMDTGDTHSLNVFRNWIPVSNSTTNTGVSLPDVTYTVVDVNGNASDVVTVTPDANNSCYADIKAEKAGTAIILVTYDAVYNADGEGGKQFSAIWPENTGVIVVTVDAEDADIQTNITVNEEANAGGKQILDVEHDILFYVGNVGAEYSFKPEDGCTVTISRSTVGNEMTFNGFTNEGVTVAEDGTVTLSGLTTGAHVVKVEKDGKAAYQVIRAREVSYKLTHSDGTEVTAENPAQPGETITVQFSKLIDPMGKLSGVYNAKYGFRYTGENGDVITITSSSAYGEYYFGSNPARQRFAVTVPTEWSNMTYTFTDGSLKLEGWGSTFGGHRSTTYMEGKETNTNASGTAGYAAVLPDVVIPVDAEPEVDTTLSTYIFNSDIDGTGWGRADAAYADKLSLFGAGVDALRWDGDTCYVTLDKKTESNAGLGFLITYKATMDSWLDGLKATVNGESMNANEMLFTQLTNGTLTAEVYVTNNDIASQSGTKTFVITVADETACDHEWTEANCTVPKTCKLCSVTRGDVAADGHNYVNDRCEYCGNYVGIEIVTGDTASSNQDIRISDFHINASGSVTSNTISEDGKATIQIKAPLDELSLTISMFGKKGSALPKAAVAINDGAANAATFVDEDDNVAEWTGTVTPQWNGNKAEIKFTVGFSSSAGFRNPKDYILTLEKVEEEPAAYTVTLPTEPVGYTVAANGESASPVTEGGSYSFTVAITEGYEAGEDFAVKANDVELTDVEGVYTIENITADQTVTIEGVVEKQEEEPVEPTGVTVTLSGLHDAQIYNFRLYTYTDGEKGATDLLEGIERIADGYSYKHEIALMPGDYWVEGVDADDHLNGGIAITVDAEHTTFQIQRLYQIYATNSGWVEGTDYTVSVEITDAVGNIRPSSLGQADNYGTMRTSCLYVVGDEVKATFTPIGERADSASAVSVKKKSTYNDYISAKIPQVFLVTITAPAESTVSAGIFSDYYIYDFVEPTVTEDENGVTAVFRMPEITSSGVQGANHFYRVQNPDGVTYWNFAKWTADTEVTVTAADLYIGDTSFTKDTVIDDYSKNIYDRADIYLNANHRGYLAMNVGDKHEWNVFRNWMAIESFYNAKVALPDVHYEVINLEGENVLSIEPDENNSSVANMTATGEGTAIVLITYDAMTHAQGQSSTSSKQFSAIWPENTGVVIVTVGEDGTDIDTNMLMDRVNATSTVMDAEHDILFYLGDEGAEFTFTPESGSTVTINRSVIENGEMTFKGFTADGVTTADGIVTLTGLTTGRHIVKVEKDGKANYQIITARGVSYELQDSNGNALTEDTEIRAGDTIKIQFTGLVNPVEKMSGAYNFNARIVLEGQDGTTYQSSAGGAYGVYDFSGNPARQVISITLPKYWAGDTYTLNGNIAMSGNANVGLGGHRGFTYAYGFTFREDSPSASLTVSRMPEITLHLAETTFVDGQLVFEDEEGNSIDRTNLTIALTDDINNKIIVAEDGSFPCVAGAYSYVICGAGYRYKTGSFTIGADDVGVTKKIVLESASENAWDGTTKTEPDKDENGVYLIGTGAELAWFAAQQDAGKAAISGKLIADIDLAGYPWDMKASSSNYATVLDGNGHKIQDLNATVGLFSYLGKDSVIKNLTLYGKVEGTTNAGSIVKYAGGSNVLIENCVNYASVTSTGSNAGGLVGYAYDGTTIKNCVNHGAVSGSSSVGGIIGSFSGASTVESCYNTGAITATGNCAGGIFGNTGSAATIKGCYNTGDISGVNFVGGVGGNLDGPWFGSGKATATDCYSIGTVTGTGTNVGGVVGGLTAAKATLTRGYSLAGTAADNSIGIVLSEAELKQASLDSSLFGGTCTGYPALVWQTDVTFHEVGETAAETVAPTCLEDGYSLYICSNCEQSTKKDIVNALGHSWCDEGEGAHTHSAEACETCEHCVYTAAVCKVNANCVLTCTREGCEVTKTKDLGGALEHEYCTHTTVEESETCEHCSVTPATCVENGSVIRNCVREGCDNEKAAEVIPFTGHTASGEANAEGLYTCSVCDRAYKVCTALDESEAEYAWVWNADKQRFESTNQGKGSTTSTGTLTLTLAEEATISFRYGVSSENGWDKLTITAVTGETNLTIANAISGSSTGIFGQSLAAGTYTLTAAYTKDSGGNSGEDLGWISAITVTYGEAAGSKPEQPATSDWQTVMNKTQTYLTTQAEETAPVVGTFKGDWVVLGLARNGVTADFMDTYYENVKTYVTENIDSNGRLHAQKSTDNSRVILGLTAIGKDVTDVAGYNLLKGLSDLNYVKTQGINGPVFALIALDSKDYPTADNATATREALVEYILSKQLTDGGWALAGQTPDDMTPMAIQALAPYYNTNDDVEAAVDKALIVMETMSATPETYAQMIVALSALGIDCETDERFANVMDNMLSFALENGSFEKGKGSGTNQMSTEQCFYALVAYNRFKNGQTALYDMSDMKDLHTVEILPCENGSVTVSKSSAMTGETITVSVAPNNGYKLKSLSMNGAALTANESGVYSFTMPEQVVTLTAVFEKLETVIEQDTTVSNGTASAVIPDTVIDEAVAAVGGTEDKVVTIIPTETGSADKVEVSIPADSAGKIADADAALIVQAPAGAVEIPKEILTQMEGTADQTVKITVEARTQEHIADAGITADTTGAVIVEVTIQKGDTKVTDFDSNQLTITIPVTNGFVAGKTYDVIVISEGKANETVKGLCIQQGEQKVIQVKINHLSTFVVLNPVTADLVEAMDALAVADAKKDTYEKIMAIETAYDKLTIAEKLQIRDAYKAFQDQVEMFELYLEMIVEEAAEELEDFYKDLDQDDYSAKVWKKIKEVYNDALDALTEAHYEEEVYELLEEYLEYLEEAAAGELEVTFRLIGDWKHDDGVSGHDEYVTWIETTEYNMPAGSTIYDLFIKAIDDFDLNQKGASKNYVESIQAPDILGGYWIGEFDNGPNSGWMYTINGDHPGYGLKEQDLEDGDEVIWHYVDDYTLEERKTTSKYYERWLEADDISPEAYVKRHLDKIVTIEGKGEVKPELKMSHIGKDVKFTFTPAEGWVVKNVYVDGKDKGAIETYTYKKLAMDARIEVVFAQNVAFQMNFVDVSESQWFYDDVYFAVSNGLFNGIDEVTFAPGASMTRAMLVTVLYRLEGQPAVYGGSAFADVAAGQWYTDAVIWATRNGIVNGLGNGKFGANDNVTREQMATILYRYAQNCGYDTTARADLNGYTDVAKISSYAQEAMSWANAMGLINGRTAASLAPTGTATRAEVAAIFHRFVENIVK